LKIAAIGVQEMAKPMSLMDVLGSVAAKSIDALPIKSYRRHPTWYPLFQEEADAVNNLTDLSVRLIASEAGGEAWLNGLVPRLTNLQDEEGAASALSELRAFGAFLEAGFRVSPIPRKADEKTPDFEVRDGDDIVIVEVFSKHQDTQQKKFLENVAKGSDLPGVERHKAVGEKVTITTTVVETAPAGVPDPKKANDSVQANLISRVCSIKGAEGQIDETRPALLWVDFANFGIWPAGLGVGQLEPLQSGHNGITSGGLWYACYGWKGAPIFEEDFPFSERVFAMGHDGRFRLGGEKKSRFSGVIFSLPGDVTATTCLFENPWPTCRLPDRTRRMLERLPWFSLSHSICDWNQGDAETRVELCKREIETMKFWRDNYFAGGSDEED
jgi:hypothetical protein